MASEFDRLQAALPRRYRLLRELDRGGMSRVYLAREELPERDVAIKVLAEDLSARLGRERFVREVEVTSRLSHPHIVPIHAAGEAGGLLYYVMPFIRGESLRDRLGREGMLPIDEALRITEQVADALAHAHASGIVHRDIKPSNILFQSGHAVVADFGVARALHAAENHSTLTMPDSPLGTPDYMSPEQIGNEREVDERTDVYALACVLYEMLGGQPPFHSRTARATMARHLTDRMPSLMALREVPPEVEEVIATALAKAPADRFETVSRFTAALRRAASGASDQAEVVRSSTRHPLHVPLQVAGALIVAGAIGFAWNAWNGTAPAVGLADAPYRDSVAMMPLENRTGDPELDNVGLLLADEITRHWQQIRELKVMGSYSVASLWGRSLGHRALLDSLDVGHLLEGSYDLVAGRLRFDIREFDENGVMRHQELYDSVDPGALDSVVVELARAVADGFLRRWNLMGPGASAVASQGGGSDAYYRGIEAMGRRTSEGLREAILALEEAVAAEASYAPAHAALSSAHALSLSYRYDVGRPAYEVASRALASAERAIELDPSLADGFAARGYATVLLGLDIDDALRDFTRAQELSPSAPNAASWSSRVLARRGEIELAYVEARRARDLDPLAAGRHIAIAALALQAGNYDQAIESARMARGLEPTLARAAAYEARALALVGRAEECLSLELGAHRLVEALCLERAGRTSEARALVEAAEAAFEAGGAAADGHLEDLVASELAAFYAFTGDAENAARWVRAAYDLSPVGIDPRVAGSEIFAPLRDDPGFWSTFEAAEREARRRLAVRG